jgi:hypothetical protein
MENKASCHVPVGTVFQSNGAPPHSSHYVCAFLDRELPDHWLGSVEHISWAHHSPYLIPLDFFFWGFIKDIVYCEVQNVNELHDRIARAADCITNEMFANTW